ncbi:hypothetical protein NBC122_02316 [Chryseobacterium salivictor]|uniref:Uncharacterized protein n=1 Tax=Chryseobacterium salivictor TaxID=2547600 RepID=A0A4P6ZHB1_9FLAO|nr:hypothetical protein NBC122_02316 [Chryseobacterium salivictor]
MKNLLYKQKALIILLIFTVTYGKITAVKIINHRGEI